MKFLHSLISFALCVALLVLGGFLVGNFSA